jgi:hypothetical protein
VLGISLACLAVTEVAFRPTTAPTKTGPQQVRKVHWAMAGMPLGSVMFMLHSYLHDSSILIAWSWTGYENGLPRGPLPHIHGVFTIVFQCLGVLFATSTMAPLSKHISWLALGSSAFYALYQYRHWPGYIAGLIAAFFIMPLLPATLGRASGADSVAKAYTTAVATYCLLTFLSVMTVAYAFVPGAVYLRERTNVYVTSEIDMQPSQAFQDHRPSAGMPATYLHGDANIRGKSLSRSKEVIYPRNTCCILHTLSSYVGLQIASISTTTLETRSTDIPDWNMDASLRH